MSSTNPYVPPEEDGTASPSLMVWTIGAVFGCSFIGGLSGVSLGAGLGAFWPGYYRSVFPNGDSPNFDPVAVGIGQGLTQGVVLGTFVGLVLVSMFYMFRLRWQAVR